MIAPVGRFEVLKQIATGSYQISVISLLLSLKAKLHFLQKRSWSLHNSVLNEAMCDCIFNLLKKDHVMKSIILALAVILSYTSCKKENIVDNGIPTTIKGHVEDPVRGTSIAGYKIVFEKKVGISSGGLMGMQGTTFEKVAEAYTDNNGDYSFTFNFKLEPGQGYHFVQQYYGLPYFPESIFGGPIVAGTTNIINMTAWKPVELKLNVQVLNNNKPPLMIRNELASTHRTILNTENIYQQNTSGTYILRTRPNSDINIIFYYNVDYSSPSHQKIIPYRSTLDSTTTLNYVIDCSTF